MLQNIKVDVIYYNTATDFEMEFNLCGCCRMRLLTDKVSDKKTFVNSLARAVSRSRVIIIVGSLFGEEGTLEITSRSLGTKLSPINNSDYGIADSEEISILHGATPLVTPDNIFGGCIIESGPQTMILISDSKNIRKSIMTNLIHPYFEELSVPHTNDSPTEQVEELASEEITEALETVDTDIVNPEDDIQEAEEITETEDSIPETEEIALEITEEDVEDDFEEIVMTNDSENTNDFELITSDDEPINDKEKIYQDISEQDSQFIVESNDFFANTPILDYTDSNKDYISESEDEPSFFRKSSPLNITITILTIFLLIFLAILCYCIFYVPSKDGITASAYLREIFQTLFQ